MPLIIDGKVEDSRLSSFADFAVKHQNFKESAEKFCKEPVRRVGRSGTLYVTQREYATVSQDDENITVLGSEDATTCHIVVLRHTGSGATSSGHFDGDNTDKGLKGMIASVKHISKSKCSSGRFELHLFGGFLDDRGTSEKLTICILRITVAYGRAQLPPASSHIPDCWVPLRTYHLAELKSRQLLVGKFPRDFITLLLRSSIKLLLLNIHTASNAFALNPLLSKGEIQNQNEPIHLCSACVTGFNDKVEKGLHKPIIYGIGINIQDGAIYPASFLDKGPDEFVRHARIFGGVRGMVEIYSSSYKELRIMPYDYQHRMRPEDIQFIRDASEEFILQNLSTSPHCEPLDFVSNTRATFDHILTHPKPLITVFPEGKPRVYKRLDGIDHWTRTTS